MKLFSVLALFSVLISFSFGQDAEVSDSSKSQGLPPTDSLKPSVELLNAPSFLLNDNDSFSLKVSYQCARPSTIVIHLLHFGDYYKYAVGAQDVQAGSNIIKISVKNGFNGQVAPVGPNYLLHIFLVDTPAYANGENEDAWRAAVASQVYPVSVSNTQLEKEKEQVQEAQEEEPQAKDNNNNDDDKDEDKSLGKDKGSDNDNEDSKESSSKVKENDSDKSKNNPFKRLPHSHSHSFKDKEKEKGGHGHGSHRKPKSKGNDHHQKETENQTGKDENDEAAATDDDDSDDNESIWDLLKKQGIVDDSQADLKNLLNGKKSKTKGSKGSNSPSSASSKPKSKSPRHHKDDSSDNESEGQFDLNDFLNKNGFGDAKGLGKGHGSHGLPLSQSAVDTEALGSESVNSSSTVFVTVTLVLIALIGVISFVRQRKVNSYEAI